MTSAAESATVRGTLLRDEPMARHTTWRVGGPAERYFRPADLADLVLFLRQLPAAEPLCWVGLGSNLLVRDGGIRGTVIATAGLLNGLERLDDERIRVEAGVSCAKVARSCARWGLVGAEFLAGVPGTMGGALAMNAGAFGGETWAIVETVETLDRRGERHTLTPAAFDVGYRHVIGPPGQWFAGCVLRLVKGDAEAASARIRQLLEQRNQSQPIGTASAGSVFRNPPGDYAARLIEAAGLKGRCEGAACVSGKHANFIVNTGGARARDIERLIRRVADAVAARYGVQLQPEVRIIGEPVEEARDE